MNKKLIAWIVGIIAAIILVAGSLFIVKEGEYKVVLKFGEAVRVEESPGLYFKIPFIESVSKLPKYQMTYESNPTTILTKDKKPIIVDNYTVWRIKSPQSFLRTVQTVGGGIQRIDEAVYNSVRRKLSEVNYDNIISENTERATLTTISRKTLRTRFYGIITESRLLTFELNAPTCRKETSKASITG
ncbi:SPFH domain-containing protein [Cohnella cholangitidis]|uniref:SPFH domain-containing protein n=1 Tax=Cohnella cholangitidis TaxID=2598458 RepID=UPI001E411542|nr:SPFH domain-containing protein [Cohnella cholangitidis]